MKRIILVLAATAIAGASAFAQTPTPEPADTPGCPPPQAHLRFVSEGEREALFEAGEESRENPRVLSVMEQVREAAKALNAEMIARDPSIEPVLEKIEAGHGYHVRLTGDEREELRADREAVKGTAADDALQRAIADYRKAAIRAMMEAAPSLAGIIEKLPPEEMRWLIAPVMSSSALQ